MVFLFRFYLLHNLLSLSTNLGGPLIPAEIRMLGVLGAVIFRGESTLTFLIAQRARDSQVLRFKAYRRS